MSEEISMEEMMNMPDEEWHKMKLANRKAHYEEIEEK